MRGILTARDAEATERPLYNAGHNYSFSVY